MSRRCSNVKFRPGVFLCWLLVLYAGHAIGQQLRATLSTTDTVLELSAGPSAPSILSGRTPPRLVAQPGLGAPPRLSRTRRQPASPHLAPRSSLRHRQRQTSDLRLRVEATASAPFLAMDQPARTSDPSSTASKSKTSTLEVLDANHGQPDSRLANLARPPTASFLRRQGRGRTDPRRHPPRTFRAGYQWTGWSTTYAHDVPGRGREIIPYEAIFPPAATSRDGTRASNLAGERASLSIARPMIFDRLDSTLNPAPHSPACQPAEPSNCQPSFSARLPAAPTAQEINYAPGCAPCLVRHAPGPTRSIRSP